MTDTEGLACDGHGHGHRSSWIRLGKCTDTEGLGCWNTRDSEVDSTRERKRQGKTGRRGAGACVGIKHVVKIAVDARTGEREREFIDNQQVSEGR